MLEPDVKKTTRKRTARTTKKKSAAKTTEKTAAKKAPARKKKTATRAGKRVAKVAAKQTAASTTAPVRTISVEERHRMIAEAAYSLAQARQFRDGTPQQDWMRAEADVDARLARLGAEIERSD